LVYTCNAIKNVFRRNICLTERNVYSGGDRNICHGAREGRWSTDHSLAIGCAERKSTGHCGTIHHLFDQAQIGNVTANDTITTTTGLCGAWFRASVDQRQTSCGSTGVGNEYCAQRLKITIIVKGEKTNDLTVNTSSSIFHAGSRVAARTLSIRGVVAVQTTIENCCRGCVNGSLIRKLDGSTDRRNGIVGGFAKVRTRV
jgi:hypothetical protein